MATWPLVTIAVQGPTEQVQRIRQLLDEHTSDERVTMFSDIVGSDRTDAAWVFRWPWPEDDTVYPDVVWMRECKWGPPGNFVSRMSRRYSDCEFEMTFSDGEELEKYIFQNGSSRLIVELDRYFEFRGHDTALVHHWRVSMSFESDEIAQSVLAAMREDGLIIEDEHSKMYRRCGDDVVAWVGERFPDAQVQIRYSRPFTLNEDYYFQEVYGEAMHWGIDTTPTKPFRIPQDLQELFAVVERDIQLTTAELHWIAESLIEKMLPGDSIQLQQFPRVERIRNHVGREPFDDHHMPTLRERLQLGEEWLIERWFIGTSADESVDLGYGLPYEPTKAELEILLSQYEQNPDFTGVEERVALITEAIESPRWTREWPQWEQEQRAREAWEREGEVTTEVPEQFLRELEAMSIERRD